MPQIWQPSRILQGNLEFRHLGGCLMVGRQAIHIMHLRATAIVSVPEIGVQTVQLKHVQCMQHCALPFNELKVWYASYLPSEYSLVL